MLCKNCKWFCISLNIVNSILLCIIIAKRNAFKSLKQPMKKPQHLLFYFLVLLEFTAATAQQPGKIVISFNENNTYQTIQNFGASDAWSCQFAGNWANEKKNAIADWLFSMDTLPNGNPKGIGLSIWRYNLGAGSAEQQDRSGIKDEWRRAALTLGTDKKVEGQNWFLQAAKERGVQQFLGFFNSPPVQFTKTGKAYAEKGKCNIDSTNYKAFADYTVDAIKQIAKSTGVTFDYISPVNEPQWEWSDGGQEGCPYSNVEISSLVKTFSNAFQKNKLKTQLLLAESGHLKYLLPANDKHDKDNQVVDFFVPSSSTYIGNMPNVSNVIASHSYFSTSPFTNGMQLRGRIKDAVARIKGLQYWQSEYCILGDNAGEINGSKKDVGMTSALYVAKVIHEDLVGANAAAWQWWTAISAYDYKDGLVYIDKNKEDGQISDSKMLWAVGNYSRFIRPDMKRIQVNVPEVKGLLTSGFVSADKKTIVLVLVNDDEHERILSLNAINSTQHYKTVATYLTNNIENLGKHTASTSNLLVPAKSVLTVVLQ